jgi:hypothetical protein
MCEPPRDMPTPLKWHNNATTHAANMKSHLKMRERDQYLDYKRRSITFHSQMPALLPIEFASHRIINPNLAPEVSSPRIAFNRSYIIGNSSCCLLVEVGSHHRHFVGNLADRRLGGTDWEGVTSEDSTSEMGTRAGRLGAQQD